MPSRDAGILLLFLVEGQLIFRQANLFELNLFIEKHFCQMGKPGGKNCPRLQLLNLPSAPEDAIEF